MSCDTPQNMLFPTCTQFKLNYTKIHISIVHSYSELRNSLRGTKDTAFSFARNHTITNTQMYYNTQPQKISCNVEQSYNVHPDTLCIATSTFTHETRCTDKHFFCCPLHTRIIHPRQTHTQTRYATHTYIHTYIHTAEMHILSKN